MHYSDRFGFLPIGDTVAFSFGEIAPVPEFENVVREVSKDLHRDGYVYPPITSQYTLNHHNNRWEKIEKTERPAHLHRLPSTHIINIDRSFPDEKTARYEESGFLIHFLGFLYGFRCQFYDWWMEGRVNFEQNIDHSRPKVKQVKECLETALKVWLSWPERQRLVTINILFLHTRTQVYENEWEKFQAEYQIIDAIFSVAKATGQVNDPGQHKKRLSALCEKFDVPIDEEKFRFIVGLRNDLLHEALWDGRMPGEGRSSLSYMSSYWLHSLSKRLILALLGMRGQYVNSPWWRKWKLGLSIETQEG
jgi:hypothetical protein